jgi:hypothetical protein
MRSAACSALALAAALASAGGDTVTFTISPGATGVVDVEFFTYLGSDTDLDGPLPISGTLDISSDDFANLTNLNLEDVSIVFDTPAEIGGTFDGGPFLGNGSYTVDVEGVDSVGPAASRGAGVATLTISVVASGDAGAAYDLLGLDPVNNPIFFDLESLSAVPATLEIASLTTDGTTISLDAILRVDTIVVSYVPALVETRIDIEITLSATGDDPGSALNTCSRADIAEPCGLLDLADIVGFVTAFAAQEPIADFDNNGLFDLADLVAFVTIFSANECQGQPGPYDCYYIGMNFDEGDAAYALGEHRFTTAGIALSGAALMLGFTAARRRSA